MILEIHIPSYPLCLFIDNFLYYKDYQPDHQLDRFFPDGNVYLVIDLTSTPKHIHDNDHFGVLQTCKGTWFSGLRDQSITIPSGKEQEMIVVNFQKGKSYPFVEAPLSQFTNITVEGELAFGKKVIEVREKVLECKTVTQMFQQLEKYFLPFISNLTPNPFIDYAIQTLTCAPEPLTIEKLTHKIGYSHRHFIKMFSEHVGLNPKQFAKIIRFQKTIASAQSNPNLEWSTIALSSGYYDLAHFHHEFKMFSGFTPNQFRSLKSDFMNYVAVN
ncbi:MAG: helix-turn-helix transcriptional regulator [Saprospiraceae bacterium]|nr:helix-turn-helix transcriptional regulator [Saprospiraceae bacterium]